MWILGVSSFLLTIFILSSSVIGIKNNTRHTVLPKSESRLNAAEILQSTLDHHNKLRMRHENTERVTFDDELNKIAEKCRDWYVEQGSTEDKCKEVQEMKLGENLFFFRWTLSSHTAPVKSALYEMYNQIRNYHWGNPGFATKTRYFTQMIWADTKKIGVSISFDQEKNEGVFVILYKPKGNIKDKYAENVHRLSTGGFLKPLISLQGMSLLTSWILATVVLL